MKGPDCKTKYLLPNRIFMSSLFDQSLFDNQGELGLGLVSMTINFTPPPPPLPGFSGKSYELSNRVLAIRLYRSE